MWVRSQDKESLLECKTFAVGDEIQYTPKEHIGEFDVFCENGILGFYSTKEKALKVLDTIELKLNKTLGILKINDDNSCTEIAVPNVFQMPLDSEVK